MMLEIDWSFKTLNELSVIEFYQLLKLRIDVFVVEQSCAYAELDGDDQSVHTLHVQGRLRDSGQLLAGARVIFAVNQQQEESEVEVVKIGRVVVASQFRDRGVGRRLMEQVLGCIAKKVKFAEVRLSAQTAAIGFYGELGFEVVSAEYLEDGIPHVDMIAK